MHVCSFSVTPLVVASEAGLRYTSATYSVVLTLDVITRIAAWPCCVLVLSSRLSIRGVGADPCSPFSASMMRFTPVGPSADNFVTKPGFHLCSFP